MLYEIGADNDFLELASASVNTSSIDSAAHTSGFIYAKLEEPVVQ